MKRVVCRHRWECFGYFIEEHALWGVLLYFKFINYTVDYGSVGGGHDSESTLFLFIFGLEVNSGV